LTENSLGFTYLSIIFHSWFFFTHPVVYAVFVVG